MKCDSLILFEVYIIYYIDVTAIFIIFQSWYDTIKPQPIPGKSGALPKGVRKNSQHMVKNNKYRTSF
jgi:hypothetical protein